MIEYALRLGVDKPIQNRAVTLRKGEKGNARLTMHVYQAAEELDLTLYDVALCVMPHGYELPALCSTARSYTRSMKRLRQSREIAGRISGSRMTKRT